MDGLDLIMVELLVQGMNKGESRFIECPVDKCVIAIVGLCLDCEGIWTWCGCGANNLDCPCGKNEEFGDTKFMIERLQNRITSLEEGIRQHLEHRENLALRRLLEESVEVD